MDPLKDPVNAPLPLSAKEAVVALVAEVIDPVIVSLKLADPVTTKGARYYVYCTPKCLCIV